MSTSTRDEETAAHAERRNRPAIEFCSRHRPRRSEDQQIQRTRTHPLSARAQRLSAHRPRQVDLPELRTGSGVWRRNQSALRRHQPREGRAGVRRLDHHRRALAGRRLGRPHVLRLRLLRPASCLGGAADQGGQGVCRRSGRRRGAQVSRLADRAGQRESRIAIAPSKRISICSSACGKANFPTARARCAPRSTWPRPT